MDYKNSVIYKIVCKDKDITDCYVGSSCSPTSRKSAHKSNCNNEKGKDYNIPVYRFIRDKGGWNNWDFVIIEKYPCEDKTELRIRERYWFEKLNPSLNDRYPQRAQKEYYEENKEEIAQQRKEYYEENKEEIAQKNKEYYEENKEEIAQQRKEYYEENKDKLLQQRKEHYEENKEEIAQQHKEYYKENKDKLLQKNKEYRENNKKEIAQQRKEYYEENKEKILQKKKDKIECDKCGSVVNINGLTRHKRTKKCQELSKLKLA